MLANTKESSVILVKRAELPLSCPRPNDDVWNMHPRIYLPLEKEINCDCPYCGARYQLID